MSEAEFNAPIVPIDRELLSVVYEAYRHGVHVEDCPMLHYAVDADDWKKCTCWFGRARRLLTPAVRR